MLRLFSPAKLNLFFRVINKREDGFHEIASLFQAISLGDFLSFELAPKDSFTCSDPNLPLDEKNLVIKALDLFRENTKRSFHVKIHLHKNIPMEAGLGGGSSNAATTLWGLNHLLGNPVAENTLAEWGAKIGSDVAFFFSGGTAMCRGRGEILQEQKLPKPFAAWIAKPNFGSSTPAVYKAIDYSRLSKADPDTVLASFLKGEGMYFNDLEESAHRLHPDLKAFRSSLEKMGFDQVAMTGSGTSYFCMGKVSPRPMPNVFLYQVQNVQRSPGHWYSVSNH